MTSATADKVSFPGGIFEKNDDTLARTAMREAAEETGMPEGSARIIGQLTPLLIPVSNIKVFPYVAFSPRQPVFNHDPAEVQYLINQAGMICRIPWTVKPKWCNILAGSWVPYFDIQGNHIWGATAMIIGESLISEQNRSEVFRMIPPDMLQKTRKKTPSPVAVHIPLASGAQELQFALWFWRGPQVLYRHPADVQTGYPWLNILVCGPWFRFSRKSRSMSAAYWEISREFYIPGSGKNPPLTSSLSIWKYNDGVTAYKDTGDYMGAASYNSVFLTGFSHPLKIGLVVLTTQWLLRTPRGMDTPDFQFTLVWFQPVFRGRVLLTGFRRPVVTGQNGPPWKERAGFSNGTSMLDLRHPLKLPWAEKWRSVKISL